MSSQASDQGTKKGVKVETENVGYTIESLARKKNVSTDKIDFDILNVSTTVFRSETIGNMTEEMIVKQTTGYIDISDELWLDPDVRIAQEYEVLLYPLDPKELHLHIGIAANASLTNIAAFIKKEPRLKPNSEIINYLTNELNKKKLKHGFLINIYDSHMGDDIKRLADLISHHGSLDRDVKIFVFNAPEFKPSTDDKIELVYQKKSDIPGGSKYIGVSPGEVLVEYTKPMMGNPSRNAKGKYLHCFDPTKTHEVTFGVTNSVKVEDIEDKIVYSAVNGGFAVIDENVLDVKAELTLQNLNAKSGSIDVGSNKNAKLDISSTSPDIDAIGDNVRIKAYEIDVKGNVGADSYLEGEIVKVEGQMHMSSKIVAKSVEIKTLKGSIEADDVKIGVLESGTINANSVRATSSLGATINANECRIGILGSHNTITVSKLLVVESISGAENRLIVTPAATKEEELELRDLASQLKEVSTIIQAMESEIASNMKTIEQSLAGAKALKIKLSAESDKEKAAVMTAKLVAFNELVEKTKLLKKDVAEQDITKKSLVQSIQGIQDTVLHAKIIAEKPWRGHNVIKFRLIEPPKELSINVDENNDHMEIFLHKTNNNYEIQTEKRPK